jgi:hypothetical protein
MAGSGRRIFAPGEVLTASNTMNYLMDQAVMNFAGTAARGSAIGTAVSEGMVSYLADSNAVEVYDGSDWKNIIYPTGSIVQVQQSYKTDAFTTAGTTFVDVTDLSVTITPKSASNKILVRVFGYLNGKAASVTARSRLVDGSGTVLGGSTVVGSRTSGIVSMTSGGVTDNNNTLVLEYLHSPNTTSAYTYKLQISADNANTIWFGRTELDPNTAGNVRGVSSITVMEIAD